MAKKIKAVKCPHCGSSSNTELRTDYYKCKSCGTEYFIDNDDITINHNHHYNQPTTPAQPLPQKRVAFIVLGAFVFIFMILFVANRFTSGNHKNNSVTLPAERQTWNTSYSMGWIFEDKDKQPVYLVVGKRETDYDNKEERDKIYAGFYDARSGKERKITDLKLAIEDFSTSDSKCRLFANGELYVIINSTRLYKADRIHLTLNEVQPEEYRSIPQLQTGFAHIEFISDENNDGFDITTNEGEKIFYYPLIQKAYLQSSDELRAAKRDLNTLPADAIARTDFYFTPRASAKDVILYKYHYRYAPGYPTDNYYYSIGPDYKEPRLIDYKDFTPGRLYFFPRVLTNDEQTLLIAFRATAAENSPYSIQLMDANTAKILWTYPTAEKSLFVYRAVKCAAGYFIDGNLFDLFIDNSGTKIMKLDYKTL